MTNGRPARCLVVVALFLAVTAVASSKEGWKKYTGAWFDVSYPATFKVAPDQKSKTNSSGYDSVRFVSPTGDAEFYVFSPQWSGHASALDVDPKRERVTSQKSTASDYKIRGSIEKNAITDTWLGIEALDGSYVRFVHDHRNEALHTDRVFGIKCKDMVTYNRYKPDYQRFRESLVQYGD